MNCSRRKMIDDLHGLTESEFCCSIHVNLLVQSAWVWGKLHAGNSFTKEFVNTNTNICEDVTSLQYTYLQYIKNTHTCTHTNTNVNRLPKDETSWQYALPKDGTSLQYIKNTHRQTQNCQKMRHLDNMYCQKMGHLCSTTHTHTSSNTKLPKDETSRQ